MTLPRANRHQAVINTLPNPISRTGIKIAGSPKAARRNHDYEKQTVYLFAIISIGPNSIRSGITRSMLYKTDRTQIKPI